MSWHILLLAMAADSKRRVLEIGWLVGGLGAIALIATGVMISRKPEDRASRSRLVVAAGVLLGIAFLLQIVSAHF